MLASSSGTGTILLLWFGSISFACSFFKHWGSALIYQYLHFTIQNLFWSNWFSWFCSLIYKIDKICSLLFSMNITIRLKDWMPWPTSNANVMQEKIWNFGGIFPLFDGFSETAWTFSTLLPVTCDTVQFLAEHKALWPVTAKLIETVQYVFPHIWLVSSICLSASKWLKWHHGSSIALIL